MGRPNILFLFSDEHSHRFMGHAGSGLHGEPVQTPTFDRLASQGTVFTDAYCQMPLCTPSRLCTLTGREVRACGAWTNEDVLRPELPTLPRALGEAGYETALIGKMHLGGRCQFVGFRHRPYGDLTGKTGHQWEPLGDAEKRHGMRGRTTDVGVTGIPESLIQDEVVAHETVAFLREHRHARGDRPWFACASFSRPHFPLTAPRRHVERYWPEGGTTPWIGATGDAVDHPLSVGMRRGFRTDEIGREEMLRARAAYFACVSYLDEVIGDLLLRLDADGLLENTVIIYSSDHGELAGEHGLWWKNGWFEGCTRVPLIFSMPEQRRRVQSASRVSTPVGLVDLFPMLCAIAGAETPGGLDGVDLSETLRGGAAPAERPIFCDALTPRWGEGTEFRAIRWGRYKYVRFRDVAPLMFDLEDDPAEQKDLLRRDLAGEAAKARDRLEILAAESIDFDEAERERTERDGSLREDYAQHLPPATGNLYLMPDGRLINADDALYHPTVIAERPEDAFCDPPRGT